MTISSAGIGSNLDVTGIVSKLMATEQGPLTLLAKKEASYQAKLSGLGSLKGAISTLQTAAAALVPDASTSALEKFSVFNAAVSDASIATASATSSAANSTYKLEVTQLAQQHTIATSTTASPFTGSGGTLVAGGKLTITRDSKAGSGAPNTTDVTIAEGSTPEAIRDAINAADAGVSASVINSSAGKQLVLMGNNTGANQFIKLSGIAGLSYDPNATPALTTDAFVEAQAAQDSTIKLNGLVISNSTNVVTTAIDGVTLNLTQKTAADKPTTLTIARDTSSLAAGVNALVKAFNDIAQTATSLGSYNSTTKAAGILNGDSTLRSAQSILRGVLSNVPSEISGASLSRLSDIGVSVQKDGTLVVDSTKLSNAISTDLTGVANLVSAYGNAFKTASDGLIGTNGTITTRTSGVNASIDTIGKQRVIVNARLVTIKARYEAQFTALDVALGTMRTTSDYLTTQLAQISANTNALSK